MGNSFEKFGNVQDAQGVEVEKLSVENFDRVEKGALSELSEGRTNKIVQGIVVLTLAAGAAGSIVKTAEAGGPDCSQVYRDPSRRNRVASGRYNHLEMQRYAQEAGENFLRGMEQVKLDIENKDIGMPDLNSVDKRVGYKTAVNPHFIRGYQQGAAIWNAEMQRKAFEQDVQAGIGQGNEMHQQAEEHRRRAKLPIGEKSIEEVSAGDLLREGLNKLRGR